MVDLSLFAMSIVALSSSGSYFWRGIGALRQQLRMRRWPTVSCIVAQTKLIRSPNAPRQTRPTFWPRIEYLYQIDGQVFSADRVFASGGDDRCSPGEASALLSRYQAGRPTVCAYDPQDPSQAYLVQGRRDNWHGDVIIASALLVASSMVLVMLLVSAGAR